jgi:DNA-binding SARP family transcriptional activator
METTPLWRPHDGSGPLTPGKRGLPYPSARWPPVGGRPRAELSRWAGEVLVTREPGYLLRLPAGSAGRCFEELTASGRRALADLSVELAGELLREALGLWRGRAFEEFLETDFVAAESDRLAELRLVALEDRIEADLRLGRQRELVADLEGLVREHPLRERLWAQLLVALYRSGRQAEALSAYQRARSILVEELGIDPGPAAAGAAWAAADRQIVDEAPAIPLLVPQGIDLVSKRVGNYQHNPPLGAVLSQLWVI